VQLNVYNLEDRIIYQKADAISLWISIIIFIIIFIIFILYIVNFDSWGYLPCIAVPALVSLGIIYNT
jgi:hypothetical protein